MASAASTAAPAAPAAAESAAASLSRSSTASTWVLSPLAVPAIPPIEAAYRLREIFARSTERLTADILIGDYSDSVVEEKIFSSLRGALPSERPRTRAYLTECTRITKVFFEAQEGPAQLTLLMATVIKGHYTATMRILELAQLFSPDVKDAVGFTAEHHAWVRPDAPVFIDLFRRAGVSKLLIYPFWASGLESGEAVADLWASHFNTAVLEAPPARAFSQTQDSG